ncbi:LLM class flavin-dependent oxidoreductase [Streptomyces durbertensis]|uniref:LLM class flavin-dependent oxidoreductase n=1 Tax=Streptomyces durbertensis TaxID=2448886 RepID=A0ABR6EGE3_9ACTN|nr:LLM class flavin-dependent oxidoreductase [Streptomyces durbertensis]MBB1244405.1 LLM class flavin-dependent oxidoreductase [Streptomyces durbertensis]
MAQPPRRMTLAGIIDGPGGHVAAWRHPATKADAQLDLEFHVRNAKTLERGLFDAVFIADIVAVWGTHLDSLCHTSRTEHFEPLSLLAAYATNTEHLGLAATATTTYNEPHQVARRYASLDHLSGGRAAWNVVTSAAPWESANFGRDTHLEHGRRYARAEEFIDVVKRLWDTAGDPEDGSPGAPFHHRGDHFQTTGPLDVVRPPQGRPVIIQAGSSPVGREFAARHAEVIFTRHNQLGDAQDFYTDLKSRVAGHGRDPERVLVWPTLAPIVAATEAEARHLLAELQELVPDHVALRTLQDFLGVDLTDHPVDGPVPDIPHTNQSQSTTERLVGLARRENLTIRGLALRLMGDILAGTPEQIADHMESWFTQGGADGFNIDFPYLPGSADDFVDHVIPELQRRGLYRTSYEGTTLRDNLGLGLPARPQKAGAA